TSGGEFLVLLFLAVGPQQGAVLAAQRLAGAQRDAADHPVVLVGVGGHDHRDDLGEGVVTVRDRENRRRGRGDKTRPSSLVQLSGGSRVTAAAPETSLPAPRGQRYVSRLSSLPVG